MKNKLTSVLLSLVIAFGLWLYVVTTVSQQDEYSFYNIPVAVEGEARLHDRNLVITGQSHKSVAIRLSGSRGDLTKVDSGNITIKVDVGNLYEPGIHALEYTPIFPGNVASNAFVVESKSPSNITFTVEELRMKEVPVTVVWTGSVPEGFMLDRENRQLDHAYIMVEGPASVADQITQAVIEVDLDEQRESISQSYRYTLCNKEGEPVDAQMITTNVAEVRLEVKIQQVKEVRLVLDVTYGAGANATNTTIEIKPSPLRLSGGEAVLAAFGDTISLGKLNLTEIPDDITLTYPITLPEGVTNLSGVSEAEVSIKYMGLSTKEIVVDEIESINVPQGMTATILNEKLTVIIRGPSAQIMELTEEDVTVSVDFTGAEEGTTTFRATVTLPEKFKYFGALSPCVVSATVAEEEA